MPHETPLITAIVAGIGLAFVFGAIANRLRIPPLVGYLLAGVMVGPFTPGLVVDQALVLQLAEIGVILLMFGVGMHFSLADLISVRAIAIPGAVAQIAVATLLGMGLAWAMGWSPSAGFVFALSLSVASTVVLLRALQERRTLETEQGRIAVGWLIVEDLVTVLALVLLPAFADLAHGGLDAVRDGNSFVVREILIALVITLGKVVAFVALMLVVGRRVIPWLLHYIAHTGSRELFRLAVLAVALGIAFGASELFDVSFALGAFFAGMILSESELSQRAAEETLPLRDAFSVLFFVSVGMLFDPSILVRDPWPVLGTLAIILFGKSAAAFVIVRAFGHPLGTALTISASLAQIGEFSFILAALGIELGLLPTQGRDLILACAILSILVNPLAFIAIEHVRPWLERQLGIVAPAVSAGAEPELAPVTLTGHAVVIGYGRVGKLVAEGLLAEGQSVVVIEENGEQVEALRARGVAAIAGNAAQAWIVRAANLAQAQSLFVAIPNAFEAGHIIRQARAANPTIDIVARAHFDAEIDHLEQNGANLIIMGEREIARGMLEHALGRPMDAALRPADA